MELYKLKFVTWIRTQDLLSASQMLLPLNHWMYVWQRSSTQAAYNNLGPNSN